MYMCLCVSNNNKVSKFYFVDADTLCWVVYAYESVVMYAIMLMG